MAPPASRAIFELKLGKTEEPFDCQNMLNPTDAPRKPKSFEAMTQATPLLDRSDRTVVLGSCKGPTIESRVRLWNMSEKAMARV